jgi:hypothetical protein
MGVVVASENRVFVLSEGPMRSLSENLITWALRWLPGLRCISGELGYVTKGIVTPGVRGGLQLPRVLAMPKRLTWRVSRATYSESEPGRLCIDAE